MTEFGKLVRDIYPHGLLSLSDQLVFYQSHHHSLFLDQAIGDALGGESYAVRRQAAFEAAHALLSSLYSDLGLAGAKEKLDLASELFAAMGHGRLTFEVTGEGGVARAEALHFGASFVEKYGALVKIKHAVDAFAAGFCSAAASLAYPSDWGLLEAEETTCVARRDAACEFALSRRPEPPRFGAILTRAAAEAVPARLSDDRSRAEPSGKGASVARMLSGMSADEAGVVRAFGVRLALLPVSYTNQITYDTMHLVEKRAPELFPVFTALVREAAQMGAFHLLAGVLSSRAWAMEHGGVSDDAEERLDQLITVTRALGWGALYAVELVPGVRLVLRSPVTHESAYYTVRYGNTTRGRLAFLQGTALGIMQILHRVDFSLGPPPLTSDAYNALFRGGTRFLVEETRSPLRGDDHSEIVVESIAD
jgi:hypothetical protein